MQNINTEFLLHFFIYPLHCLSSINTYITAILCYTLVLSVLFSVMFIAETLINGVYVFHHLCIILGKSGLHLEEPSSKSVGSKTTGTSIKDVLKEQKFLEKKVALSRKRKRDSRYLCICSKGVKVLNIRFCRLERFFLSLYLALSILTVFS